MQTADENVHVGPSALTPSPHSVSPADIDRIKEELEAKVIAQDHRPVHVLIQFLNRKTWTTDDKRRSASIAAIVYLLLSPATLAIGAGTVGIVIAGLSYFELRRQNGMLDNQNALLRAQYDAERAENLETIAKSSFFSLLSVLEDAVAAIEKDNYGVEVFTVGLEGTHYHPFGRLGATAVSALSNYETNIATARGDYEIDLVVTDWWTRERSRLSDAMALIHLMWNSAERSGEDGGLLVSVIRSRLDRSTALLYMLWMGFVCGDASWERRLNFGNFGIYFTNAIEATLLTDLRNDVSWYRSGAESR